jgi:hypothetical protein
MGILRALYRRTRDKRARFDIITTVQKKTTVLWDTMPWRFVFRCQCFEEHAASIFRVLRDSTAVYSWLSTFHTEQWQDYALVWKGDFIGGVFQNLRDVSTLDSRSTCLASNSYLQSNALLLLLLLLLLIYLITYLITRSLTHSLTYLLIYLHTYLLIYLLTAFEFSLGGSGSSYSNRLRSVLSFVGSMLNKSRVWSL